MQNIQVGHGCEKALTGDSLAVYLHYVSSPLYNTGFKKLLLLSFCVLNFMLSFYLLGLFFIYF